MEKQQIFYIDKITNSIEDVITGKSIETSIIAINKDDLKNVLKKNGGLFNWKREHNQRGRVIYKLVAENHNTIEGLISLEPMDGYIECI